MFTKFHGQSARRGRRAAAFVSVAMALATLPDLAASAEAPKVVVTTKPIHSLVASVMSGVAEPKLLVEGAASPHTFTLKPSGARAINDADVFVRVSEHIEPFTHKVAESLPKTVTLLTLADAQGVRLLDQRQGGTFEKHEHHGESEHDEHDDHDDHGDDHGGKDGHIWLDPANAKAIVENVASTLAAKYPEHAEAFKTNAAATLAKIDALKSEIDALVAPAKAKPFIVFHDATQYFEKSFGLDAAGSITVSPDVQPSAKRLTEVRRKIASLDAACVFAEPDFQPKLIAAVTEGTKSRSGMLDAEGALLKPGPDLYFELMRGMARGFAACLV